MYIASILNENIVDLFEKAVLIFRYYYLDIFLVEAFLNELLLVSLFL